MKKTISILISFFIMFSFSCRDRKLEDKTKALLDKAKETEYIQLCEKMKEYASHDENYFFNEEINSYNIKQESANHILLSLYNFHKENHISFLTDQDHPENWENYFHFYDLLINNYDRLPKKKAELYFDLSPKCDYCLRVFEAKEKIDPNVVALADFPAVNNVVQNKINTFNEAKQKADAEEAEKKRIAAEQEAERKRMEEERKRIEASRFKGISNYKFGMTEAQVEAQGGNIDKYAGYQVRRNLFYYTGLGELYNIWVEFKKGDIEATAKEAIVSALCEKYKFKFLREAREEKDYYSGYIYTTDYGIELQVKHESRYNGWTLRFFDRNLEKKAETEIARQKEAAIKAKKSALKNSNDL